MGNYVRMLYFMQTGIRSALLIFDRMVDCAFSGVGMSVRDNLFLEQYPWVNRDSTYARSSSKPYEKNFWFRKQQQERDAL